MRRTYAAHLVAMLAILCAAIAVLPAPASAAMPSFVNDALVVGGINNPRSLDFFPNGSILVVENDGGFVFVSGSSRTTLGTLAGLATSGEQGLLGVAIDPDYPARPYIFVHYTTGTSPSYVQIARFDLTNVSGAGPIGIDLSSQFVLLSDIPNVNTNHNGGTVRFGPDKKLYLSIGDDAQASGCTAQNLSFLAGKILRINVDDSVDPAARLTLAPLDNPFYNASDANASLVWAMGLRNPFRFDIDQTTGKLYIGDVGQNSWEEVDVSAGGENFGWPYYEANNTYRGTLCPGQSAFPAWTRPIYQYPNPGGASVIMAALYRGVDYPNDASFPPAYDENAFFFDFYSGNLRVLRQDANSTNWSLVAGVDAVNFATAMSFVPDMQVGPDGALYWVSAATSSLRKISYLSPPVVLTDTLPPGTVGVAYDSALVAGASVAPYTWSLSGGALPAGLSVNSSTGHIEGTPTGAGTASFTVQVRSATNQTATKGLSLQVADPITVTPGALADGVQNQSYLSPLAALGGVGPFVWALESGVLPPGLQLTSSSGHIAGTPTAFGDWAFIVNATDAQGRVGSKAYTLHIVEALYLVTASLPQGQQGTWYTFTLDAGGGAPPFTWSVNASSSLPAGLNLGATNGTIYGVASAPSATSVVFDVRDSGTQATSVAFDLVIAPPPGEAPLIATVNLPRATLEVAYGVTLQVAAGVAPLVWTLTGGTLPPGLAFDPTNATIFGIATVVGNFSLTFRVTDNFSRYDERSFPIEAVARARTLTVLTTFLPSGTLGEPYGPIQLEAAGTNLTLPLLWTVTGLPPGVTANIAGLIEGTIERVGTFQVHAVVSDSSPTPVQAQAFLGIGVPLVEIYPPPPPPPFTVGVAVVFPLNLSSPVPGAQWSVFSGMLPPGLRLDADGVLRGTPTTPGNYTFEIEVTKPSAPDFNAHLTLDTVVVPAPPTCSPCPPPPPPPHGDPYGFSPWLLFVGLAAAIAGVAYWQSRRRTRGE